MFNPNKSYGPLGEEDYIDTTTKQNNSIYFSETYLLTFHIFNVFSNV